MGFAGEKSTGWSGPLVDSMQDLQETPLRVEVIAEMNMSSRLTTTVCPRHIPINWASIECYHSATGKTEEVRDFGAK